MTAPTSGEPEILVLPDAAAVSAAAAERVVIALTEAIETRGRADWATTGGSAPGAIYRLLADPPLVDRVDWSRVHLWWGDDRFVPYDHNLSNVLPVDTILLPWAGRYGASGTGQSGVGRGPGEATGAAIPPDQIHPFPIAEAIGEGYPADWAAARYAESLRTGGVDVAGGWPAFDLALIGIGPDGHLLSAFPGSPAFDTNDWALGIPAPTHVEPHVPRVTLNPRVLDVARQLLVVSHGASKAPILGEVFGAERDERRWPAQVARRPGATWILDEAAGAGLPSRG